MLCWPQCFAGHNAVCLAELTVLQRQQAVRVWAMRLWPVVPSSVGCGAPSVFGWVAVATSIARLLLEETRRTVSVAGLGGSDWDEGEKDACIHAQSLSLSRDGEGA